MDGDRNLGSDVLLMDYATKHKIVAKVGLGRGRGPKILVRLPPMSFLTISLISPEICKFILTSLDKIVDLVTYVTWREITHIS